MQRKTILGLLLCAACFLASASDAFGTLYASRSAGGTGELYTISSSNGALVQDIGPLNDLAGLNYPITGLAFNPLTGVLYGSTGNAGAVDALLVTITPATAQVTVVGPFNAGPVNSGGTPATMSDIDFDSAGNLYGVGSIGGPQLYSINTATGKATVIGSTGLTSTSGGGVGISPGGTFFGTPTSSRFGTYNSSTGAYTNITAPTLPVGGGYAALAFDGGTLYGLDLGPGSGGTEATALVTIDQGTGAVTNLGSSPSWAWTPSRSPCPNRSASEPSPSSDSCFGARGAIGERTCQRTERRDGTPQSRAVLLSQASPSTGDLPIQRITDYRHDQPTAALKSSPWECDCCICFGSRRSRWRGWSSSWSSMPTSNIGWAETGCRLR